MAKAIRDRIQAAGPRREDAVLVRPRRDIKAGDWERQIEAAMKEAAAAVLMVSDNFLASDYIIQKELPRLVQASKTRDS